MINFKPLLLKTNYNHKIIIYMKAKTDFTVKKKLL